MEVEEEKKSVPISPLPPRKFQFANGDIILIPDAVVKQFITLTTMVEDFPVEDEELVIPLERWVEKPILQWIIDAYVVYLAEGGIPLKSLNQLYDHVNTYNRIIKIQKPGTPNLLTLFGDETTTGIVSKEPSELDMPLLYKIATTLNWLDADAVLKPALKTIYTFVDKWDPNDLAIEYAAENKKRGIGGEMKKEEAHLPYTPLYKREKIVRDFLSLNMPYDLLRANRALQKYANPIAPRYRDTLLIMRPDGLYEYKRNQGTPVRIAEVEGVPLFLASSRNHSLCLTTQGLYVFGNNSYGQLGLGNTDSSGDGWKKLNVGEKFPSSRHILPAGEILFFVASDNDTHLLTTQGLFGIGQNRSGELGVGNSMAQPTWRQIKTKGFVRHVHHANGPSTFVLTSEGLYACGSNQTSRLSIASDAQIVSGLQPVIGLEGTLLSISSGFDHVMFVTTAGVYGAGLSQFGSIPDSPTSPNGTRAVKITTVIGKPLSVHCGGNYTFLLTTDGLYATGANHNGQLGLGDLDRRTVLTKVTGYDGVIQSMTCLENSVFLVTTRGVYQSGEYLGLPLSEGVSIPNYLTRFRKLDLDLGYFPIDNSISIDLTEAEEEEERKRKRVKLSCDLCRGKARFIASSVPYCSKYCLLQIK